ncbi:MAG: MFS transporter [Patescibacteria group bacterium]
MIDSPLHYFHHLLRREISELYWSSSIRQLATTMMVIFTPIYFYKLNYTIQQILWWFIVVYLIYTLTILLVAKIINYTGYELAMTISVPIYILFILALYLLPAYPSWFYLSALFSGLYKSFYWPAYHADFARFGSNKFRGEEIGFFTVITSLIEMLTPAVAGFILDWFSWEILFLVSSIIFAFSVIPMLKTRERVYVGQLSIRRFFRKMLSTQWRRDFWPHFGSGEEIVAQAIWPIFIFGIVDSYGLVGLLTTLSILASFAVFIYVGRLTDAESKTKMVKVTSWSVVTAWLVRTLAINWFLLFIADTIFKISRKSLGIPVTGLIYNRPQSEDEILEYVCYKEFVLSISKVILAFLCIVLFMITAKLYLAFVLASLFTLFYLFWREDNQLIVNLK